MSQQAQQIQQQFVAQFCEVPKAEEGKQVEITKFKKGVKPVEVMNFIVSVVGQSNRSLLNDFLNKHII